MTEDKKNKRDPRYPLRLPPDLYEVIQQLAEKNFHSANAEIVRLLRKAIELESVTVNQPPNEPKNSL